jgi:hypothetical protein
MNSSPLSRNLWQVRAMSGISLTQIGQSVAQKLTSNEAAGVAGFKRVAVS